MSDQFNSVHDAIIDAAGGQADAALAMRGGFNGGGGMEHNAVSAAAVQARETAEIQSAYLMARANPRNENRAAQRALEAFQRPAAAQTALYAFPRGGQTVEGPSVDVARELARIWGNIRYGVRIVEETDVRVHIKGWALDLETGVFVEVEDKFPKRILRKKRNGEAEWKAVTDEREIRELVNRRGAICERNALLKLLPGWLVDETVLQAKKTLREGVKAGGTRQERIRRMVAAFASLAVTVEMLERYLKHPLDVATEDEMVTLQGVYKSIADGNSKRDEYFALDMPVDPPKETPTAAAAVPTKAEPAATTDASPAPPEQPSEEPPLDETPIDPESERQAYIAEIVKLQNAALPGGKLKPEAAKAREIVKEYLARAKQTELKALTFDALIDLRSRLGT